MSPQSGIARRTYNTPGGRRKGSDSLSRERRPGKALSRQKLVMWAFVVPAVIYTIAFFGLPIANNLVMSFEDFTTTTFYTGNAPFVGLDNYAAVVKSPLFVRLTINTAVFTFVSLSVTFVIGLLIALFFNAHFPLNSILRSLMLLPWLLPLIISAAVWRRMMDEGTGVINQILNSLGLQSVPWLTSPSVALVSVIIVNVWIGIPFVMIILYGGLQEIPKDYYEAASLDGATGLKAFLTITWPLLRPVVVIVLMLGFIYTIRVLDIVLALTGGGPANATQTYATQSYQFSFVDFKFGLGAALSNILIVVSLIVAAFQMRSNRRSNDLAG